MVLTGNVFTGDALGNVKDDIGGDGAAVPGPVTNLESDFVTAAGIKEGINIELQGEYGTIIIDENGNYTYTQLT